MSTPWPLVALTVAVPALLLCGLLVLWLLPARVSPYLRERWTLFVVWSAALVAAAELLALLPGLQLAESLLPASLRQALTELAGTKQHAFGIVTLFRWLPAEGTGLPEPLAVRLQLAVLPLMCTVAMLLSAAVPGSRSSPPGVLALCLCCVLSLFSVDVLPAILFWLAAVSCCGVPPENADEPDSTAGSATGGARISLRFGDLLLVAGGLSLASRSAAADSVAAGWPAVAWLAVVAGVGLRCGLLPCVMWPGRVRGMSATAMARVAGTSVLPAGLILVFRISGAAGPLLNPGVRQFVVWWGLVSATACAVMSARASALAVLAGYSALAVLCTVIAAVASGTPVAVQAGLLLLLSGGLALVLAVAAVEVLSGAAGVALSGGEQPRRRTNGGMLLATWALVVLPGGLCGWNALAAVFRSGPIGPVAWLLPVTQLVLAFSWARWWFLQTAGTAAASSDAPARAMLLTQLVLAAVLLWLVRGTAAETGPASRLLAAAVASTETGETAAPVAAIPVSTVEPDSGLLLVLFGGAGGWFAAVRQRQFRAARGGRTVEETDRWQSTAPAPAIGLCRLAAWLDELVPAKLAVFVSRTVPQVRDTVAAGLPASPAFSALAVLLAAATLLWVIVQP